MIVSFSRSCAVQIKSSNLKRLKCYIIVIIKGSFYSLVSFVKISLLSQSLKGGHERFGGRL